MPITLNNSNISVTYNTGSNYIIETVKSDLYVRGTTSGNLSPEPTVSPSIRSDIVVESFTYTTGTTQTTYTKEFLVNTICDILIVGGGGAGDKIIGAGGGGGAVLYATDVEIPAGSYPIKVGKGGVQDVNGSPSEAFGATCLGGGSTLQVAWMTENNGRSGGSGSGGSLGERGITGFGGGVGSSTKGQLLASGTLYNGNSGGNSLPMNSSGARPGAGGGGGGANSVGKNSISVMYATRTDWINAGSPSSGGNGVQINIDGNNYYWGAGGGGGAHQTFAGDGGLGGGGAGGGDGTTYTGFGGTGGSSNGGSAVNGVGGDGAPNTGSGGGGGAFPVNGGNGGSGIVIIRYRSLAAAPTSVNMVKTLNFNYYSSLSPTIYTLTFNTRTLATINNSSDKLLNGSYTITLGNTLSTIVPTTANQNLQDTKYSSSTISVSYHTLNPILDTKGAQWTYSSTNPNVYHLGSVGIGTTSPEYSLDVRGNIFTSVGGYTQTGTENWIIQSDRRIKENIVKASYEKCLDNIKKIELYNFNFKENYVKTNDRNQLGFIAQEVQEVYPKAVIVKPDEKIEELLTVNTTQIKYTLYGAVRSLIEKVERIEERVDKLYKLAIPDVEIKEITSKITEIFESTSNISNETSNIII
jgi:hypothetical protein